MRRAIRELINKATKPIESVVRMRGLEPPLPFGNQNLNLLSGDDSSTHSQTGPPAEGSSPPPETAEESRSSYNPGYNAVGNKRRIKAFSAELSNRLGLTPALVGMETLEILDRLQGIFRTPPLRLAEWISAEFVSCWTVTIPISKDEHAIRFVRANGRESYCHRKLKVSAIEWAASLGLIAECEQDCAYGKADVLIFECIAFECGDTDASRLLCLLTSGNSPAMIMHASYRAIDEASGTVEVYAFSPTYAGIYHGVFVDRLQCEQVRGDLLEYELRCIKDRANDKSVEVAQ